MATPVNHLEPHWVRADPTQDRVLDAVGLSTILDDCAAAILPGISVLTRRARYLSFHCWARRRAAGGNQLDIHAWEVSLAHAEHGWHKLRQEPPADCSYLGKNNIEANWHGGNALKNPISVTQTPGWLAYRPALVTAGLVAGRKPYPLTDDGDRLASYFQQAARPPRTLQGHWQTSACLSRPRSEERIALRQILGVQRGGKWSCQQTTAWQIRQETISQLLEHSAGLPADDCLRWWCSRRRSLTEHGKRLVKAGAWSALSFGMTVLLATWVSHSAAKRFQVLSSLRAARRRRGQAPDRDITRDALGRIAEDLAPLQAAISAIREALAALEYLDDQRDPLLRSMAMDILTGATPGDALEELTQRHELNKGALAWTIPENRASMPKRFARPGMRLDALLSLIRDVGIDV